ncbi:flagellar hook-associated protein FlgK [Aurantiacibacter xanthus]|uniref:Flagellar hook-associated protein 1 n=1 Tax=Aurantiacibacter xanthus TaxID=1784712 RepID=A0A3A1P456_9SPHN|nr:flagellar hook-associated protein FlgK [Aurantiacibacter xanthus]RIV81343.1 flagellar hook-associated protein FlgK [Aurantiacibacter xanthus]
MAADMLTVGLSGTKVARGALEITANNIANASTEGYVRRSAVASEVSAASISMRPGDISLSGARISAIHRNADMFRQAEVRRTSSDSARAASELNGLENIESAVEGARVFDLLVGFEASLSELAADPTDPSLRAAVMSAASNMAGSFRIAHDSLDAAAKGLQFEANGEVEEVNIMTGELARINLRIGRTAEGTSERATLLDQRDGLLEKLSKKVDVQTTFNAIGQVEVRAGGASGELIVQGGSTFALGATTAADGTISFDVGGAAVTLGGGSLAGKALGLQAIADTRSSLDTLASGIMNTVNTAQGNGAALNGASGQPLFSGTGASDMRLAFTNGEGLATAPAGSPAGSTNAGNLTSLRSAMETNGHAQSVSNLVFSISAQVAGKKVTSEALDAISSSARIALDQQSGVDLDQEAANLMRFQQAFQASGRVMQVATEIFDTLLGIR